MPALVSRVFGGLVICLPLLLVSGLCSSVLGPPSTAPDRPTGGPPPTVQMRENVATMFPGSRAKQPPSEDPQLGRELVDDQVSANTCFQGQQGTETRGDKRIEYHFESASSSDLSASVSAQFGGKIGGSFERAVDLVLEDLSVSTLDAVFFDPRSTCAQRPDFVTAARATDGTVVRLVTGAVKAKRLVLASGSGADFQVDVDGLHVGPVAVGAEHQRAQQKVQVWEGEGVYFTERVQCFKVQLLEKKETIALLNPVDLGGCSFTTVSLAPNGDWTGRFSCEGEAAPVSLEGHAGEFESGELGRGVSYRVRASQGGGVNLALAEIRYWLTYPTACTEPAPAAGLPKAREKVRHFLDDVR